MFQVGLGARPELAVNGAGADAQVTQGLLDLGRGLFQCRLNVLEKALTVQDPDRRPLLSEVERKLEERLALAATETQHADETHGRSNADFAMVCGRAGSGEVEPYQDATRSARAPPES
ncbi:protein of unknown function [Azospirillum lipoferum 4B]|uniref:Uncharacterized protein n=1 Tax=Azospirillum lipoferum (strain 4B) TaxID=862719 RepID=G7Z8L6_AZOL4|nr:protein of unknown function [Azospirillum lipoferum 4B]